MPQVRRRTQLEPYMEIDGWMIFIDPVDTDRIQCPECEGMQFHVWQMYCNTTEHMAGCCPDCGFEVFDDDPSKEEEDEDEEQHRSSG